MKNIEMEYETYRVKAYLNSIGKVSLEFYKDGERVFPGYARTVYENIRDQATEMMEDEVEELDFESLKL